MNGLTLQEDMAATLQARLSWPQADACAADLMARFDRMMRNCPLTCQHCRHAPATAALVADLHALRVVHLVCGACGQAGIRDASQISASPSSVWLFMLIPASPATGDDHA